VEDLRKVGRICETSENPLTNGLFFAPVSGSPLDFFQIWLRNAYQVIKIFESNLGNHNLTFGIDA